MERKSSLMSADCIVCLRLVHIAPTVPAAYLPGLLVRVDKGASSYHAEVSCVLCPPVRLVDKMNEHRCDVESCDIWTAPEMDLR